MGYVGAVAGVWLRNILCVLRGRCSGWFKSLCGMCCFVAVQGLGFGVSAISRRIAAAHKVYFCLYYVFYCCVVWCWWPVSSPFVMVTVGVAIGRRSWALCWPPVSCGMGSRKVRVSPV